LVTPYFTHINPSFIVGSYDTGFVKFNSGSETNINVLQNEHPMDESSKAVATKL
jgi:hypothetical protein